jgi:hypothetical protein
MDTADQLSSIADSYGFSPIQPTALSSKALPTLAELCNMGMARRTTKGRPKKPKAKISRSMPSLKKDADRKRRKDTSEAPAHFAPNGLPGPLPMMIDTTDQPSFADNYERRGDTGLTNLDVYALTLGPSYSRHLSSMTTASSVPDLQQPHLAHFQIYSEHARSGKVAFYRYFAPNDLLGPLLIMIDIDISPQ